MDIGFSKVWLAGMQVIMETLRKMSKNRRLPLWTSSLLENATVSEEIRCIIVLEEVQVPEIIYQNAKNYFFN